jgi:hypothetical protein
MASLILTRYRDCIGQDIPADVAAEITELAAYLDDLGPRIDSRDWDMTDWPADQITVSGLAQAIEGCGNDDEQIRAVTPAGREMRILGVRALEPSGVQIVIDFSQAQS